PDTSRTYPYHLSLHDALPILAETYKVCFEGADSGEIDISVAMAQPLEMAVQCNRFIEVKAPWKIPEESVQERNDVIYTLIESLRDRKSTRLNSSHVSISYAVF